MRKETLKRALVKASKGNVQYGAAGYLAAVREGTVTQLAMKVSRLIEVRWARSYTVGEFIDGVRASA